MQVRGKSIKGVEIVLVEEDARELAHILDLHLIEARRGEHGRGSSVDKKIDFCEALASKIRERVE